MVSKENNALFSEEAKTLKPAQGKLENP